MWAIDMLSILAINADIVLFSKQIYKYKCLIAKSQNMEKFPLYLWH